MGEKGDLARGAQRGFLVFIFCFVVLVLWAMGRVAEVEKQKEQDIQHQQQEQEQQQRQQRREEKKRFNHAADATIRLRNGHSMPMVGLGTAALQRDTLPIVDVALKAGYKLFDTAADEAVWYQNERQIGSFFANFPMRREQVFFTTKLHPNQLGFEATRQAIKTSLQNLQTSYIDLYLIHFPFCFGDICSQTPEGTWEDSWRAIEEAYKMGRVRAIGVSNFHPPDLKRLIQISTIKPDVVQSWFDPTQPQVELREICEENDIVFQAYSLLGSQQLARGARVNPVLTNEIILKIAEKHERSSANIVLRWALQLGIPVIPRSNNPLHVQDNINLDGYELSQEEMEEMNNIWRK